MDTAVNQQLKTTTIKEIKKLTESTFIVRMDRLDLDFRAGQYLRVGLPNSIQMREYSIYSGENDDYLEILVKEILDGEVSQKLCHLKPGDALNFEGPFGFFGISEKDLQEKKFLFVASGTGVAPFHSFVRSYKNMDYFVLHGVRTVEEAYGRQTYNQDRYFLCTTKDKAGSFNGRVTDFLIKNRLDPEMLVYLCGNSNMIYDAYEILQTKGFSRDQIFTEAYF
ncbi:MAG TPA: FAD-binding oxidoreductase [Bacteroidales bacterium]|nr:FAD-binding oxidoreductase [Bacteroidales bacterium]